MTGPHDEKDNGVPLTADEQFLWDGMGTAAPSTKAIEGALRPLRFEGVLEGERKVEAERPLVVQRRVSGRWFAIAAGLMLAGVVGYVLAPRGGGSKVVTPRPAVTPVVMETWTITQRSGEVLVSEPLPVKETMTKRVVTTGRNAGATVKAGGGTVVTIEPSTTVELADGNSRSPWIGLTSGSVFAQVDRADRPLMVGVHGEAMTLRPGAAAAVSSDANAGTQVMCKSGEVHFDWDQKQTRVLGPATCAVNPETGPALPFPAMASKEACSSIDSVDHLLKSAPKSTKMAYSELHDYLQSTNAADATTLWNMLWRVPEEWRAPVRDRLAKVIQQPKSDPQMVLKLDPVTMDAWWNAAVEATERR